MYKTLLCWRYLRTRYIALASIISVTLGVATLIVVNSVMAGFTREMHDRLHGILSDIVLEAHSLDGFADPEWHMKQVLAVAGDDIAGMTPVVHVPALLRIPFRDSHHTRQINLIGVDKETYAAVSDFSKYLLHPENQKQLSFLLRDGGYAPGREDFPQSGWGHRRTWALNQKIMEEYRAKYEQAKEIESSESEAADGEPTAPPSNPYAPSFAAGGSGDAADGSGAAADEGAAGDDDGKVQS